HGPVGAVAGQMRDRRGAGALPRGSDGGDRRRKVSRGASGAPVLAPVPRGAADAAQPVRRDRPRRAAGAGPRGRLDRGAPLGRGGGGGGRGQGGGAGGEGGADPRRRGGVGRGAERRGSLARTCAAAGGEGGADGGEVDRDE